MTRRKRNWEVLTRRGFRGGGNKTVATLTGDSKAPILLVGALLKQSGFSVKGRYELLFDRDTLSMGLRPTTAKGGFRVTAHKNIARTSTVHAIRAQGFCKRFGLNGRYTATSCWLEEDVWVLPLTREK